MFILYEVPVYTGTFKGRMQAPLSQTSFQGSLRLFLLDQCSKFWSRENTQWSLFAQVASAHYSRNKTSHNFNILCSTIPHDKKAPLYLYATGTWVPCPICEQSIICTSNLGQPFAMHSHTVAHTDCDKPACVLSNQRHSRGSQCRFTLCLHLDWITLYQPHCTSLLQ